VIKNKMNLRTKLIQKLIHFNELLIFYPKLRRFYLSVLSKTTITVMDVGANKGQSIDFFLKVNSTATIHSFEPNLKLYKRLIEKYSKNKKIILNNLGVSNINGFLEFHENILDETSTFEELNINSKYLAKKAKVLGVLKENIVIDSYKVEVVRMVDYIKNNSNVFFDVVKIDVEGHELQCLQGLFDSALSSIPIRFIQLESHNDDMYLNNNQHQEIEQILNQNYFFKCIQIPHGFGDFVEIVYENKKLNEA